jgi:hypothetical protein
MLFWTIMGITKFYMLWLKIYYHWFLGRDGYCHCDLWFFMLFWTVIGITKFYKLWPEIYYHWFLDRDGYFHFPKTMTCDSLCSFGPWRVLTFSKDYDQRLFSIISLAVSACQVLPCICNIVFLCVLDHGSFFGVRIRF